MLKHTRRITKRRRTTTRRQRGGSPEENKELLAYKNLIDTLFFGARNTSFGIPDKYRPAIMRGMVEFAMEQLHDGTDENTQIIYDAYEKWAGEHYEPRRNDDNND